MAREQTEDELNLKRKARRRLIGAVALTLAVVVILPMVLDREPKPGGQDIDLRIPSPDAAGKFVPGVAASEVAVVAPPAMSAVNVAPAASTAVVTKTSSAANQAAAQAQADAGKVPEESGNRPASGEGFVVQVGAYSNSGAAKNELNRVKKWGFKAYTEKAGGNVRVRVGPIADREKAEKIRQQLEKHGLNPVVMNSK